MTIKPDAELRRSQIVNTYGPGSMLDLPDSAVLIGGLDSWYPKPAECEVISEPRLGAKIRELINSGNDVIMVAPPVQRQDDGPFRGVTSFQFPNWFLGQVEDTHREGGKDYRSRPLIHSRGLVGGKFQTEDGKKVPVVPVRFVQACVRGHISDIYWKGYVHEGESRCAGKIWLDEGGAGGDLSDVYVRCSLCKKRRSLAYAKAPKSHVLGKCKGYRIWLGGGTQEACGGGQGENAEWNRLLVRAASNAYFSQSLTAISIPDKNLPLRKILDEVYGTFLIRVPSLTEFKVLRTVIPALSLKFEGYSDSEIWAEVVRRRDHSQKEERALKAVELETLRACLGKELTLKSGEFIDFKARPCPVELKRRGSQIEGVVLVESLREVVAQIGFTRFDPVLPDIHGELQIGVQRAPLSRDELAVPAVENLGEGIFIAIREEAIESWRRRPAVKKLAEQMERAFELWSKTRSLAPGWLCPDPAYVMLHSLSHLLISSVAMECGYAASSIRERLYARAGEGYGILLYTGSSGSEGTLGGLVQVGLHLERHLAKALEYGRLCSNDPVCAQHRPDEKHAARYLHGAACHACLLISETSCERGNEFLDRSLVVPTVDALGAEFFEVDGD